MHLVFWDKSTYRTFSEAAKGDRGIAVVAILFQVNIYFLFLFISSSEILKIIYVTENTLKLFHILFTALLNTV